MNIAVTTASDALESMVFREFAQAPFLLIVHMETMRCTVIPHTPAKGSDVSLAKTILDHDCEALIAGKLSEEAFQVLADAAVTRYCGTGMTAAYALEAMENRALSLIRNADGTDECASSRQGLEDLRDCRGHDH